MFSVFRLNVKIFQANLCLTLFLSTVTAARPLTTFNAKGVAASAYHLVSNTRQVADSSTTNEHNRVLLKVVPFAGDVNGDFLPVAQLDPRNLTQSRVRLLGGHRTNLQTNALLLGAFLQDGRLALASFGFASLADELINGRH